MSVFILNDATGVGNNEINSSQAFVDLVIIANDGGIGVNDPAGGTQLVTYARTLGGAPQLRLDALVNTVFNPDYGGGPQQVDVVILAGLSGFVLDDGTSFANNGTALPPTGSGLPGATLNTTANCLLIYDTQQNICVARNGSGDIDLSMSNPVLLYHELSHAFRIVNNTLLALTGICDPSSPEERAAIIDENDVRTQIAIANGVVPELRDPDIHCGQVGCDSGCCIIATVATKSFSSGEVQQLRTVRDHFVRSTESGFEFFENFFYDYYSFSPEVCKIMAGNSHISDQMLEGCVGPILDFWKMMIKRSQGELSNQQIGSIFLDQHKDMTMATARYAALSMTKKYWLGQHKNEPALPAALVRLLGEKAMSSEYIRWAIATPLEIYYETLSCYLDGGDAASIGTTFINAVDSWVAEIPITDIWASLPYRKLKSELNICDKILFRSPKNQKRFRQRLVEKYEDITPIQRLMKTMVD